MKPSKVVRFWAVEPAHNLTSYSCVYLIHAKCMNAKQSLTQSRGPSNINRGLFVCSLDVAVLTSYFLLLTDVKTYRSRKSTNSNFSELWLRQYFEDCSINDRELSTRNQIKKTFLGDEIQEAVYPTTTLFTPQYSYIGLDVACLV